MAIDISQAVECREVIAPAAQAAAPGEKIIEAVYHVSVLLESGDEAELDQLRLAIDSPERRLRVVDFQPRTELASELAGDVEVNASNETTASVHVSPTAILAGQYGPVHLQAASTPGVGVSQNRGSKETYHRLAPKQLVLASGTTNAEHGVFFKWRRSTQSSLEGSRDVTCRFAVPEDWRADWVTMHCEALARHHSYFGDKVEPCGQTRVFAALYLSGDRIAQHAAYELSEQQARRESTNVEESPTGPRGGEFVAYKLPTNEHHCGLFALASAFKPSADSAEPAHQTHANHEDGVPAKLAALRRLSGARPTFASP